MGTLAYRILDKDRIAITGRGNCEDKHIIIPDEIDGYIVVAIDDCAFRYDRDIVSVKIANTIIHIGDCAFYDCKNLKYILFPEETYVVGTHAFACNNKLEQIVFGRVGQLEWFGKDSFYNCNHIKNIEISRRGYDPKIQNYKNRTL